VKRAVVLALLLASGVAAAQPNDAERLYTEGQKAYDDKRYDDALAAWDKSYELSHLPGLVFNIAQAHRLHGDCWKAVEAYRKFVELDPSSPQRATAEGLIKELEPCKDAPAPVVEHHDAPLPPPPPKVRISVGQTDHVDVDRGHGKRVAAVAVAIAGLAAIGTGVYFGGRADSLATEVHDACAMGCAWADVKDRDAEGHTAALVQWGLLGAGAAALVTSGILYYVGATDHGTVAVTPHGGGATLSWARSF
jgi:tetratricopeptide (TPR) repeat protein